VITVEDMRDVGTRDAWWHAAVRLGAIDSEISRIRWHAEVAHALTRSREEAGTFDRAPDMFRSAVLSDTYSGSHELEQLAIARLDEHERTIETPATTPTKDPKGMFGPDGKPRETSYAREILSMLRGGRPFPPKIEGPR
jgi:hypothetical protein